MCIKLFTISVSVILWLIISLVSCNVLQKFSNSVQHPALAKLIKMRCTRRFSPGVCVDNVAPVWTFVFMQQNCTERLGCPNNYRTNRFRSHRMCMKRCRSLVDMYLKMVEFEERSAEANGTLEVAAGDANDTDYRNLREGFAKFHITASGSQKGIPVTLEDQSDDLEEEEYKEAEPDTRFIVYKDSNINEDIMLADLDYVPGEIRSEVDLLHW